MSTFNWHSLDLREVAQHLFSAQTWRKSGKYLVGRSPFRDDKHPSFGITAQGFKDFATGQSGGVLDFVALALNVSHREAAQWLAESYGNASAPRPVVVRPADEQHDTPPSRDWQLTA